MELILDDMHRKAIEHHGEMGFPDEVCGFLIGTSRGDTKTITDVWSIANAWDDAGNALEGASDEFLGQEKRRRFFIPPGEWQEADQRARREGKDILGCYHTHPNHPARPSVYDLEMARGTFPGYSYIILSVQNGVADEMTSWVLRDDYSEFDEESITPPGEPYGNQ